MGRAQREKDRKRKRDARKPVPFTDGVSLLHSQNSAEPFTPTARFTQEQVQSQECPDPQAKELLVNKETKTFSLVQSVTNVVSMVGDDNREITDDVIDAMLTLMRIHLPPDSRLNIGFYSPVEIKLMTSQQACYRNIPLDKNSVLVHPLTGHWVTSFYSVEKNCVYVYDSLQSAGHYSEVQNQIKIIYSEYLAKNVRYVDVQQQNHLPVCGVMALAFAASIYFDKNPEYIRFNMAMLRTHLRNSLSSGTLTMFPTIQNVSVQQENLKSYVNPVHSQTDYVNSSSTQCSTWTPLLDKYFSSQASLSSSAAVRQAKMRNKRTAEEKETSKATDKLRKQRQRLARDQNQIEIDKQSNKNRMQKYRNNKSKENIECDREKNRQHMITLRKTSSLEFIETRREQNRNHMKLVRGHTSPTTKMKEITLKREFMKTFRSERNPDTIQRDKEYNRKRMQTARNNRSLHKKQSDNKLNKQKMKIARSNRNSNEKTLDNEYNRKQMQTARNNRSPSKKAKDKESHRKRMQTARNNRTIEQLTKDNESNRKQMQTARSNRNLEQITIDKESKRKQMQTARSNRSLEQIIIDKESKRKQMQTARSNRSLEQITKDKESNRKQMQTARSNRSPRQITIDKESNRKQMQTARSNKSLEQITKDKESNRKQMQTARSNRSPGQIALDKESNRKQMQTARSKRNIEQVTIDKEYNRKQMLTARTNRNPSKKSIEKESDKQRKKNVRQKRSCIKKQQENERNRKHMKSLRNEKKKQLTESDIIHQFEESIKEGPIYICSCCWRCLYRRSVIKVKKEKYHKLTEPILKECFKNVGTNVGDWICNTCDKKLKQGKIPAQAQTNNLSLVPIPESLKQLTQLEVQLILKVIPFMKIVAMPRGAQHGLHGQVVLVPADLNKVSNYLPNPSSESQIIALSLKRKLSDKHSVSKQFIRPEFVTNALATLKKINPFYSDVQVREDWINMNNEENSDFWRSATCETRETDTDNETDTNNKADINIDENQSTSEMLDSEDEVENDNPDQVVTELKNRRAINADTCIQPVTGPEIRTNDILNLAPGEGQIPVSVTKEPHWEALAFPVLFPTGRNTFCQEPPRKTNITPKQYINARLLCTDTRFAENPEYTFAALDWLERETIAKSISITTRKNFQEDISVKELRDPKRLSRLLSENQLFTTFKNVRGTPQYFKQMHLDMMAKLRQLGPYTFFITGSAAEFHWPQVIKAVAKQYGEILTDADIALMNWQTKRMWLQRNPVTAARHIDFIFEQLWGKVILSGLHPVGQVLNYDLRKEMQGRGTAHFHAAIHVAGAPKLDHDSDQDFIQFADKYISCQLPDECSDPELYQLVLQRQKHHHTRTCKKNKTSSCRFGYPRCPSNKTILSRVPTGENCKALQEFASNTFSKIYEELSKLIHTQHTQTLTDLLQNIGITEEEYNLALSISHRRTQVIMKRQVADLFINNYNPLILKCLKSNMDIQIITSIWACIAYITSYICKPEKTMSELMQKASKEASESTVRDKLFSIGNVLRKGREVSHHEAIMKVLSIPLRRSNIPVQFISTDYRQNRTRMLKPNHIINNMEDDETDIYVPGIHEKYAARPRDLENLCLAEFVANYSVQPNSGDNLSEEQTEIDSSKPSKTITLSGGLGKMSKRKNPQVIRYHYVSKENDEELFYHRLLLLYLPWRSEGELHASGRYKSHFEDCKQDLLPNIKKFEPYYDDVEIVLDTFDPDDLQAEIWNEVATQIEQDKQNPDNITSDPSRAFLDLDNLQLQDSRKNNTTVNSSTFSLTTAPLIEDKDFYSHVQSLNAKQRLLFDYYLTWATNLQHRITQQPSYIFLSGGAGVGKSHLIHAIYQGVTRVLRIQGQNPSQPPVILTASTGKAAANINGLTLHSAFGLPVKNSQNKLIQYSKPGAEKLNTLRASYANLKLIIADEISMFGARNLSNLSLALQDIFQEYTLPFAGLSILAVGDLLQLNPVGDKAIFKPLSGGYEALAGSLWVQYFKLFELTDIMRQRGDPEFAEILSRLRTGQLTSDDEKALLQLHHTDITNFTPDTVYIYLTNAQVDSHNQEEVKKLEKIVTINAADSKRDRNTNTVAITIPETSIYNTGNLPRQLTVGYGAKVMLTKNIDTSDHLVNGIIGKVTELHLPDNPLKGIIYVDFGDDMVGKSAKTTSPRNLKHCVPISAVSSAFFLTKPATVAVERTMFPLVLAYAITSHKSQGATYKHVVANLDKPNTQTSVMPGQVYTILSRVTSRNGLKLINFSKEKVKVNMEALSELESMRLNRNLTWRHSLPEDKMKIGFLNIRSLPAHSDDIQKDPNLHNLTVLCLSETHVPSEIPDWHMDSFDVFLSNTSHGLAICVQNGIPSADFPMATGTLECMARVVSFPPEDILVICVYKQPKMSPDEFVSDLHKLLKNLQIPPVILLGGDFNMDPQHHLLISLASKLNLHQIIHHPTHRHGRVLDHIYITSSHETSPTEVIPLPYTDHYLTCVGI